MPAKKSAMAMKATGDKVLNEHKRLMQELGELDEWAKNGKKPTKSWNAGLARRASKVAGSLKKHFGGSAEETLFEDMRRRSPHLMDKLSSLGDEHDVILKAFTSIAKKVTRATPAEAKKLAAEARATVALVRRHEAEENEMIMRSFLDDLGEGD